jgi:hypothetical protein
MDWFSPLENRTAALDAADSAGDWSAEMPSVQRPVSGP